MVSNKENKEKKQYQIQICFRVVSLIVAVDEHVIEASFGVNVGHVKGLGVVVERLHLFAGQDGAP